MKRASTVLMAVLAGLSFSVMAQTPTAVDQRQAKQQERIDQAVKSGTLTGKEAARLEKGQEHVQKMETKAAADGKVTTKEAKRIDQAQNTQSRHIVREKNDRQNDRNHDGKKDRKQK